MEDIKICMAIRPSVCPSSAWGHQARLGDIAFSPSLVAVISDILCPRDRHWLRSYWICSVPVTSPRSLFICSNPAVSFGHSLLSIKYAADVFGSEGKDAQASQRDGGGFRTRYYFDRIEKCGGIDPSERCSDDSEFSGHRMAYQKVKRMFGEWLRVVGRSRSDPYPVQEEIESQVAGMSCTTTTCRMIGQAIPSGIG